MISLGIVRKIDELGRITIPKEIRDKHNMKEGTEIEIFTEADKVVFRKYKDTFCHKCLTKCEHEDNFCRNCGLRFTTAKMYDLRTKDGRSAGIVIEDDCEELKK